ncbi:NADP(H)-dependent aldo-keto reductase [Parathalassolituus penaei]|uniref:Protein tas n=1 Tax=Parathalassolituus penaei TaxID=2997323 RepID=A0A9X3EH45_9GAMM|nr:NADP(H)-dependent aldo-keto reductase [Parathalassolituus penaei]MCY0966610.1 NADP(H)-dependent aldo-keto reductase [Parathalassolituus penaei]
MQTRPLGHSGLHVSKLCLGTMTWGQQNNEAEGHEQMDYAVAAGINFFDTAEMYPVPPKGETQGRTESIIGSWFARSGKRQDIILATKVAGPGDWMTHIRNGPQLNRAHIREAIEGSLHRLQTDYVDLYQLHWPSRSTNFFGKLGYVHNPDEQATPLEETLAALVELISEGKIRHYGLSNETPWGTMKVIQLAQANGWPLPVSVQNPYNLLNRSYEVGMAEVSIRENVGLLAYSPMAFGALSGKYLNGQWPEGARMTLFERFSRYKGEQAEAAIAAYAELAREYGLSPAALALAFVTSRNFVTSNIIGATNMTQLRENIATAELVLDAGLLEQLEAIHRRIPNPCP